MIPKSMCLIIAGQVQTIMRANDADDAQVEYFTDTLSTIIQGIHSSIQGRVPLADCVDALKALLDDPFGKDINDATL